MEENCGHEQMPILTHCSSERVKQSTRQAPRPCSQESSHSPAFTLSLWSFCILSLTFLQMHPSLSPSSFCPLGDGNRNPGRQHAFAVLVARKGSATTRNARPTTPWDWHTSSKSASTRLPELPSVRGRHANRADCICQSAVRKWQVTPRYLQTETQNLTHLEGSKLRGNETVWWILPPYPEVAPGKPCQRSKLRLRA